MKKKSFFRGALIVTGAALLSFVVGIFLFDFVMKMVVGQGDEVVVPAVVGLDESKADRLLGEEGLYLVEESSIFDAEQDSGRVLTQRPEEGERVKRGRRIHVVVSRGPERLLVPEVSGLRVRQARIALTSARLRAEPILRVPHDRVEKDLVIATSPVAGTPVLAGDPVRLLVSLGPERTSFLLPDLTGKRESEVRRHLNLFGLSLSRVTFRAGEGDAGPSVVVAQTPPAGSKVDSRTSIEVEVSAP